MGFLSRLFKKEQKKQPKEHSNLMRNTQKQSGPMTTPVVEKVVNKTLPDWADPDMTDDEKETVAVIATAGLANSHPSKKYRVKEVYKVDQDWLVAGLAAISGVSQGENAEKYRIKSIKRVKVGN